MWSRPARKLQDCFHFNLRNALAFQLLLIHQNVSIIALTKMNFDNFFSHWLSQPHSLHFSLWIIPWKRRWFSKPFGHLCGVVCYYASLMKQMANWNKQRRQRISALHDIWWQKHKCPIDFTQSAVLDFEGKGVLLSRKSSWQAGALRLMKLKPRVGRQTPLLAVGSPGVKPCNMLLFPAPSRPRTRTWRFPRSSSSCR